MTQSLHWQHLDNTEILAQKAADLILKNAEHAIAEKGCFKLVLAGGSTPENAYRLLIKAKTDWGKWHIYYGDERTLAADHKDRNSKMAYEVFLKHTAIPASQIHAMPTELGTEAAKKSYQAVVEAALPFDLVLLGMGEDGHTASLFPDHFHDLDESVHAIYNSPKPPSERISLSVKTLGNSTQICFLISENNKQQALAAWKKGDNLPVASIKSTNTIEVLLAK
ncbi:MAG: 6-phosphogluconolactonase [Methylococcales bacterium]|nr:6-phosphogluconolactonase [Methylococcales bacterium]MCK5925489.1 6-phosphogluconolactonase [Methylococcales bacterium]